MSPFIVGDALSSFVSDFDFFTRFIMIPDIGDFSTSMEDGLDLFLWHFSAMLLNFLFTPPDRTDLIGFFAAVSFTNDLSGLSSGDRALCWDAGDKASRTEQHSILIYATSLA